MVAHPSFSAAVDVRRPKAKLGTKARKRRRQMALESLENRVVLSYTFSYNPVTMVATATGTAATDALVIEPVSGFLEYSVNGSPFSGNWGGFSVPAAPTVTVDTTLSSGDGSSLELGTPTGPASQLLATFSTTTGVNTADTLTIDDSHGTLMASPIHPYSVDLNDGALFFAVSGPGFISQEPAGTFGGGVTLLGSPVNGDLYNVNSSYTGESVTVITGAGTTSTVNVAPSGLNSPVAIYGASAASATTLKINDAADTTNATATLDNASPNVHAPYEVTGLSLADAPIEYGAGVTALDIFGGTSAGGTAGVTYDIYNTQAGTTTTINGGPEQNHYQLSDQFHTGGLSNILGPVAVNGGGAGDSIELDDIDNNASDNYTITSTTVTSTGPFGGLTYGGLARAGSSNWTPRTISVPTATTSSTSTARPTASRPTSTATTGSTRSTSTAPAPAPCSISRPAISPPNASTVNVLADSEPVNISSFANSPAITTVNIGSTGGPGSMAGIQGAISVVNALSLTSLNFHDENDASGQTWHARHRLIPIVGRAQSC